MKSKCISIAVIFLFIFFPILGQSKNDSLKFHLKTECGLVSNEFIIYGNYLAGEFGLTLSNGYSLGCNYLLSELENNRANFGISNLRVNELIYTTKIMKLFVGYELITNNGRHGFIPKVGPFYAREKIQRISFNESYEVEIFTENYEMIGISLECNYQYNFSRGISLGVNSAIYLAMDYGFTYFTLSPFVAVSL